MHLFLVLFCVCVFWLRNNKGEGPLDQAVGELAGLESQVRVVGKEEWAGLSYDSFGCKG